MDVRGFEHIRGHHPQRTVRACWYEGPVRPFARLVSVRYASDKRQGLALYHHTFSRGVWLGVADADGEADAPIVHGPLSTLGNVSSLEIETADGAIVRCVVPALMICADGLQIDNSPVILAAPPGTAPRLAIIHRTAGDRLLPRIEDRGIVQ